MKGTISTRIRDALRSWRPVLLDNLGLKLLSFVCAFVLYAFVHGAQDAQRTIAVDLVALLPQESENRALLTPLPSTVRVSVHGSRSMVDPLRSEDFGNLRLDLRSGRSGRVPLHPSMVAAPPGVDVDMIDPGFLDITWDEIITRDIPVQVNVTGDPANGFIVKSPPEIHPKNVRARGPRQIVDSLQFARSEPFDVTGLTAGVYTRTIPLDAPPTRVTFATLTVSVTTEINRKLIERMFSKLPVVVVGVPRAVAIPAKVDVSVVGPAEIVDHLRAEQLVPRVDPKGLGVDLSGTNSVAAPVLVDIHQCQTFSVPKTVIVKW